MCRNAKPPRSLRVFLIWLDSKEREQDDVDAEKSEVQKADARPPQGQVLARSRFGLRRIRAEGPRKRLDYGPSDRSLARRHHAVHQARRKALDSHLSGQALHQEARGNAQGQGRSGTLGRGRQARPHHVRDGRYRRSHGARSSGSCRSQAADSDQVRHSRRRALSMARRIEKIREAGVNELEAQQKELTELIFRLRFQLTTGQAEALKRLREAKKDLARVKTLLRAHELKRA